MSAATDRPLKAMPMAFWGHVLLALVAIVAAMLMWTREKEPKALTTGDVTVWSGSASKLDAIRYETKTRKVSILAKKDDAGRYFVGTVDREAGPEVDGGAPAAKPAQQTFVSVGAGQKLAESVAPLKALRALGHIPNERAGEFGLSEPDGTLVVVIDKAEHKLTVGGPTPGGSDRYVRDEGGGEVFAIKGDIVRDLDAAESRLLERDLHEFKDNEIGAVKVAAGGKTRDLVRSGPEGKKFWADPSAPDTNDETIGNWMSKVDRLRPLEYTEPPTKELVARFDYYRGGKKAIGFLEVYKAPSANGKADYFVTTERLRLLAKVTQSVGEQVEQDVGSVVR